MIKSIVKASLVLALTGSSVFAQTLTEARQAIDAEQFQKANTILKSLISSKPDVAENYFYLGNIYLSSGYADSARNTFTKGLAVDAKYPLNYVGLGALALRANNKALAEENFKKAIDLAKRKDNDPYVYTGKAYLTNPKPDLAQAISNLEKAIAIDEKDAEAYLALGDAYRSQDKVSEAFSAYRTAYDLDKNLLRAKIELGVINKRAQAWQESIDEFNSVLAINPNYGPAYRELAETYLRWANVATETPDYQSRIKQALDSYVKYMDMTDRSLDSRMRYADFLILSKDYKALEKEAQEMAKIDNTNPRIYRYLGYSAFENGNYAASIEAINNFISKVEKDRLIPLDYVYLAKAQLKSGEIAQGLSNLKLAVTMDSTTSVDGLSEIAKELYDAQKFDLAAEVYELAATNPNAPLVDYYYQGNAFYYDYAAKKKAEQNPSKELLVKADSAYSYLLAKSPTTEAALLARGRVHRQMDDVNDSQGLAVPYYEQYVALVTVEKPEKAERAKSGLIEAYTYLGAVAARRDQNNSKAKEYFNKVLQLDPSNASAQQSLKALASN